ncbi:MAG: cyclic nucleotide-binding domain-containing protein [Proteobacteria bacterium]|nr:cyclic nucleotide-binding domain-containing protein [Pseudomonadota bacterium]
MLSQRDLDFLRGLSVFAGLRDDVTVNIGKHAERIEIESDRLLYREGEPANEMAVVLDGKLDVIKKCYNGLEVCIASLGPGDIAGEMSLIDIQPRSADVWARAPVSLAVLKHVDLISVYREDKQSYTLLVLNIAREISIRLRRLDTAVANIKGHILEVTGVSDVRGAIRASSNDSSIPSNSADPGAPAVALEKNDGEGKDTRTN